MQIIECVPNFSEGRNQDIINQITKEIDIVDGITLLDVDPGYDTNRTVVTFVGPPDAVINSAFNAIKKAQELIDMNNHKGEHARMGATDVCPLVPISNISMIDCVKCSNLLAERVANELKIPIFLYENSSKTNIRKNLANIRSGEFEGMEKKMKLKEWHPDYGPSIPHKSAGVTAIGARNFLIAYNINLNTKDRKIANDIALDVREQGRNLRNKEGKFIRDDNGIPLKKPGILKSCKAVGWFIEEYGIAQVSMNLTDINITAPHIAFDEVRRQARKRGVRVTGSELVGLLPLKSILDSGKYFLKQQKRSTGIPEIDIINIAIKSMGLNDISKFEINKKIIEYKINNNEQNLIKLNLLAFCNELSSESPAPGGGSVAALSGALGASLTSMVANLTFGKNKWKPLYNKLCKISEDSQNLKKRLLILVDEDTESFNDVMDAYKLPKISENEIQIRNKSIETAMKRAAMVPFKTLEHCSAIVKIAIDIAEIGNENSITDSGVAGEMANAGGKAALLNILINLETINDKKFTNSLSKKSKLMIKKIEADMRILRILVYKKIKK